MSPGEATQRSGVSSSLSSSQSSFPFSYLTSVVATIPYGDFDVDADTVRFVNSGVFLYLKTRFQLALLKII